MDLTGHTISHYRILEHLGGGGMGVVYKARDLKLNRDVALKFLPPELTRDSEAKQRFVREAQAASALQHNNICAVHDIDETPEGQLFIVMDFYDGETLKKKIANGPLRIDEAIDIAVQVALGLAKAHHHLIVHRDIKPANVIVTTDGVAKIVDFGLAKLSGQTMLTRTGSTVGTIAYMSPEQTRGETTDHRTDIWSLGVLLYEMISGQRPFRGDYDSAVIYAILNARPEPVTALRSAVPVELDHVVQKCMSKDPRERYQHLDDLLMDLRSCLRTTSQGTFPAQPPAPPPRSTKRPGWYGAAAGLVLLALLAYVLVPHDDMSTPPLKMIAVLPFENLGPAEDEYFADGLTDEITSRLSSVRTLGVISRTSAIQYKKTTKPLPVVAKELGVDYILEGTIRWVKTKEGQRIRITPQLIEVSGDVHLWADNIDRTLVDIFAVQTEIATQVVRNLDLVLGESEKRLIEAIPTENLEAYQAYLRGLSFSGRNERSNVEMAIAMFDRAVTLDSTFALAYAQLSRAHLGCFWYGYDRTPRRLEVAKAFLDRAFSLQPESADAWLALSYYYYWGFRDYDRALEALAVARDKLPNDSRILRQTAYIWRRQGRHDEAVVELKKAIELDPQSSDVPDNLAITLHALGRYAEAVEYYDRSIALLPDQSDPYIWKASLYLRWRGDTAGSRRELERVPTQYHPWYHLALLDVVERNYPAALARLERAPMDVHEDQFVFVPVAQSRGIVFRLMNDGLRARASFDTARVLLESEVRKRPDDTRLHASLGVVYAGLGKTQEAVREAKRAVELLPLSADAMSGGYPILNLALVYTMLGMQDAALDRLEFLLSLRAPKVVTASSLRLDPMYDPLRNNARFEALLAAPE